jgi:serine/threonine protein kinase
LEPHKRRLSTHIATRLYRSPEVIILEKHYFKALDVWAAGVIMGDLFKYAGYDITKDTFMSDPNVKRSL